MLPADKSANPAKFGLVRPQPFCIAIAPDQPLAKGRNELAVVADQRSFVTEEEERVVERFSSSLVHAKHNMHLCPFAGCSNFLGLR